MMKTRGGNITDKRSRGIFTNEGELGTMGGWEGWMEMDGEWDISDKRFIELLRLK